MAKTQVTKDLDNKTLIIEQTFDVPKEALWHAYADRAQFETWWGPVGWETNVKEFDFQPGGRIHYGMTCVDESQGEWFGRESWGLMEITSIDEPNSFTGRDYFSDADGTINENMPPQNFVVEFVDDDGKTRMVNRSIVGSIEQLEELIKMGMVEGFSSQLEKLEKLVTT